MARAIGCGTHRPCFQTCWFCCMNKSCRTTLVTPERYRVTIPGR
jgi:hypothetical protein